MSDRIPGAALNVTISTATVGPASGLTKYQFTGSYDTRINLSNVTGVDVIGGSGNDEFLLGTSTGNFITVGSGNDEFIISSSAADLAGNVLMGDGGFNQVVFKGSGQSADLTAATFGIQSSGIDAVVGSHALSGETVDLTLGQVLTTSLNGGVGKGGNRAFAALIGTDGRVNLTVPQGATLVGVLNAVGAGFDANGAPLNASDTAALNADATSIGNVAGTLARTYTGSTSAAVQNAALEKLDAYVFATGPAGAKTYETVWTDGTITTTNTQGVVNTFVQPAPTTSPPTYGLGTVQILDTSRTYDTAVISTNASGVTAAQFGGGTTAAAVAVTVGDVSGTIVQGDSGVNGGDYFNLAASAGNNTIIGSPANDVFDIGTSGALTDMLRGGGGFNAVTAQGGANVDLTANNAFTSVAAKDVQAVVGSTIGNTTVEVDLSKLTTVKGAAIFEAFLGSVNSTVTVSALTGAWLEVGSFAPGAAASMGATAVTDADFLDTLFGATKSYDPAKNLTGYLFEKVIGKGANQKVVETVTIYTDGALANTAPAPAQMTQHMSQMGSAGAVVSSSPPAMTTASHVMSLAHPIV